jgi:hypothetical protein
MKIHFECKDEYVGEEEMLAYLLIEGDCFLNDGWWEESWHKGRTTIHVNCNDTFSYASADAEDISYSEISELYEFVKKDNKLGSMAWCIKKRKVKPIPERCKQIDASGIWTIEDLLK